MQPATPITNRAALALALTLGLIPLVPVSASADIVADEIARRHAQTQEAEQLLLEGRAAFEKGNYEEAVNKYRAARSILPPGFAAETRRREIEAHLGDGTVALAQEQRRLGKYDEARTGIEQLLTVDPNNQRARQELEYLDDPIRTNPGLTYAHTQNIDRVRRHLYTAEGYMNLGLYDQAIQEYNKVLRIDKYNSAARRGMERIHLLRSDYYRSAYDEARAALLAQVDAAWEMAVPPAPDAEIRDWQGDRPTDDLRQSIEFKLKNIIVPSVDFDETTVGDAVDYLRMRSRELDVFETDPARKGINFVIQKPSVEGGALAPDAELDAAGALMAEDPTAARVRELKLRNVPLVTVLQYICEQAKLRYKIDEFAVTLLPLGRGVVDDIITRRWSVPPNFLTAVEGGGGEGGGADPDPFGDAGQLGGTTLTPRRPLREVLQESGIDFPPGASAQYLSGSGTLVVSNTAAQLDLVDQLVEEIRADTPKMIKIMTKFVEVTQENTDELSFDWIVTPFGLGGVVSDELFFGGGTVGSGQTRTAADFISPVAFTTIPGIPAGQDQAVSNIMGTSGIRSGDSAITRNSIDAILNNPNRSAQVNSVAPGILSLTGLFNSGQVQMIMRGLAQKKGADIMTAPSVMARPGSPATIEIIREFIYPTEYEPPELPNQVGATGGIGGGIGGGAGIFPVTPATPTAFETRNTGVTLEIEPNVGADEYVIDLRFAPEIVEFEGFINYGSPITSPASDAFGNPVSVTITENRIEMPVFSTRRVNTGITIYDGHTVAVGGLISESVQDVEDKVPILGDIPLIGRLFQSSAENHIKSNLIIFVTAQIVDPAGQPKNPGPGSGPVPGSPDLGDPDLSVLPPIDALK